MKTLKNNVAAIMIAIFLLLTIAVPCLTVLPKVDAQTHCKAYLFIVANPSPIGIGQTINVVLINSLVPAQWPNGTSIFWVDWTLTVIKPDGTNLTSHYISDWDGSWNVYVVPDQVGNWSFQFTQGGQLGQATYGGRYYDPATSNVAVVTVQETPLPYPPLNPIPTDYWTRPINAENTNWGSIAGNWLEKGCYVSALDSNYQPYSQAPNSAHILWRSGIYFGGVSGGPTNNALFDPLYAVSSYNPLWLSPIGNCIIINGWIYYSLNGGLECQDIRTGKEIWWENNTSITCGQDFLFNSPQSDGNWAYLWSLASGTYKMYNAYNGRWILNMTNALTGTVVMGPDGELLVYIMGGTTPNRWLAMWNSTAVTGMMTPSYGIQIAQTWSWTPPQGGNLNWLTGVQYNVTLGVSTGTPAISKLDPLQPDVIYSRQAITQSDGTVVDQDMGISIKPATFGQILWGPTNRTAKPSAASLTAGSGTFVEYVKETATVNGYDMYKGDLKWSTQIGTNGWQVYQQESFSAGFGVECFGTYEGITYGISLTNGTLLWKFYTGNAGQATPYGEWPFYGGTTVADGKLYCITGEHTPINPIWHGEKMYAVDIYTGQEIWNITGLWINPLIADGIALTLNAEDNQLYSFGKGQTDTTVQAPMTAITAGTKVVIQGTVTDQSPGAPGTPAISDNDMSAWMQYLYNQQPIPSNATGVSVTLDAIDPNGNYIHIGNATSDLSGLFHYTWTTPDIPGDYAVTATFGGSNSYFSSYAETAITVGEAPTSAPAATTQPTQSMTDTYFVPAIAGLFIFVAIIAAAIILMLRKRT